MKQAVLSTAENQIYRQFQRRVWADMQRLFPRLAAYDSPRAEAAVRRRALPEEREEKEIKDRELTDLDWEDFDH